MIKIYYSGNFDLVGKIIYFFSAVGKIPRLQITPTTVTIQGGLCDKTEHSKSESGRESFSDNS